MPSRKPATRTTNASATPPKPIASAEWDFSKCPADEATFCRRYEFARHNEGLKDEIAERRKADDWRTGLSPEHWDFYKLRAKLTFFRLFAEFPDTPWLKIPTKERTKRRKECRLLEGPFWEVYPDRLDPEAEYPYSPLDVGTDSIHRVSVVEIDLSRSKDAICQSFGRWLDSVHRDSILTKEKRGGLTDADLLKAIAAYRLLEHFSGNWNAAMEWSKDHSLGKIPLYGGQSEWNKNKRKAEKFMAQGIPTSTTATLLKRLDFTSLSRDERAKVKVYIMVHVDRAEARRLNLMPPAEALAELRALAHKNLV